ncbi:MAG: hypothetical protein S4CHLAM123_06310 [Chlamydiales bacterium]|nr:hypothetical protein [Chlamydiales bacterium]
MRKTNQEHCIVLAGRFYSTLAPADWDLPLGRHAWGDTEVLLPFDKDASNLVDLFTGKRIEGKKRGSVFALRLEEVFESLPVSLLRID